MKNLILLTAVIGALVLGIVLSGCEQPADNPVVGMNALSTFSVDQVNGNNTMCTELLAGQTIAAGTVCFEVVGSTLNITYTTTGGWELTETHLWVGCNPEGYPMTNSGNPKVGNFPYKSGDITGATTYTVSVNLNDPAFAGCLGTINCETGNLLYAMAHAAVRKVVDGRVVQTETGWGGGTRVVTKGNWATRTALLLFDDSCGGGTDKCYEDETAYAYGGQYATCFDAFDCQANGVDDDNDGTTDENGERGPNCLSNDNRWGWTNGLLTAGTYTFDLYAGAGQCDLSAGTVVGTATVVVGASSVTVTYNTTGGWMIDDSHVFAGCEPLARKDGAFTVAPGQMGSTNEFGAPYPTTSTHVINVGTDNCPSGIYVSIHAAVLKEKPCP